MAINNTPKPSNTINNTAKPTASVLNNVAKPDFSPLWTASVLPWQLSTPWLLFGNINNTQKP